MPILRKLWCILPLLALAACSPATHDTGALTQLPVHIEAAPSEQPASLTVSVQTEAPPAKGYRAQYLDVLDWEIADATLSNLDGTIPSLNTIASAAVSAQLARTATLTFKPLKATGNYSLTIDLKRRDRSGTYQVVATGTNASFTIAPGANTATVTLAATANGQLTVGTAKPVIQFSPPPVVSSWTPSSASPGMLVTITGSNFDPVGTNNQVTFNGTSGTVSSGSATQLLAEIPSGATTGQIGVASFGRLGNSSTNFTVLASGTVLATYGTGAGPQGIKRDSAGNMWIANFGGTTMSKLAPDGTLLATYAVGGNPYQFCFDFAGDLWIVNNASSGGKIFKMASNGSAIGNWGVETNAVDVVTDSTGEAYAVANQNHKVHSFKPGGGSDGSTDSFPGAGTNSAIAVDSGGNLWVAISDQGSVAKMAPSIASVLATYPVGNQPSDLAIDGSGNIWVCLDVDNKVVKMLPNGTIAASYPCPAAPKALSIDPLGNIWLAHTSTSQVTKMSPTGTILGTYTLAGNPNDIAFDTTRAVWVTLGNINCVVKLAL